MRTAVAIPILLCGALASEPGCRNGKPAGSEPGDIRAAWQSPPPHPVEHPRSVIVAQGPAPLVFQVQEPTVAHVLDLTTGLEIASSPVKQGELVYVSERTGAFAGKRRLAAGPFEEGHRYGISVDVGSGESWQSKIEVLPPPPPNPATQPHVR